MVREDRKADFFPLSTPGGSESKISLPERHDAGQWAGLQEAPGEPTGSPTPATRAKVAGQEEDGRSRFSVEHCIAGGQMRSLGNRGRDHFEPGVPDAIKGLGVAADKLLGSSGVPCH